MRGSKESGRRQFVTYRTGHAGFPGWGGMRLSKDPAGIPLNRPHYIENGRPDDVGNWVRRPGQEQLNTVTVHAADAWFRSITDVFSDPMRLYIAAGGCVNLTTVGFSVVWFDIDQEPRLQAGTWYETVNEIGITDIGIGLFDGHVYLALSTATPRSAEFRRYQILPQPWGTNQVDLAGLNQEYPLYTFDGENITWMEAFDDLFLIGLDNGTTGSADNKIAAYDTVSMYDGLNASQPADRDDLDFPVTVMGRHRDFIVAGYSEAANMISVRESGPVPGVYHDITPAAGTIRSRRMKAFRNILFIVPGGTDADSDNIWAYDDADPATFLAASLTIVRTIANASITCVDTHNGFLYYGWRDKVGGGIYVGRYDGTTWGDTHKQLNTQGPGPTSDPSDITRIDEVVSFRGSLYAVVYCPYQIAPDPTIEEGSYLIYTEGNDSAGDWHIDNTRVVNEDSLVFNKRRLPVSLTTGGVVQSTVVL